MLPCSIKCYLTTLPDLGVMRSLTQLKRKSITLSFTHECTLICWFVTNNIHVSSVDLAMNDVLCFSFVWLSGSSCTALQHDENFSCFFEKAFTYFVSRMGCSWEDRSCQIKKDVSTQRLINRYVYDQRIHVTILSAQPPTPTVLWRCYLDNKIVNRYRFAITPSDLKSEHITHWRMKRTQLSWLPLQIMLLSDI